EFVVGGTTGIETASAASDTLSVVREGADIVVYAPAEIRLAIYSLNGSLVRVVDLNAGRNVIEGLAKGTYVIGGVKIML
ncbi:MAG: hypothetical protein K2L34_06255, partial [Muribaculaceae bacterium]|nr:hypothetical protein [Muribaculaceae bacterium]